MSSSTTPIKQAKPAAPAGSEKDPVRMIEKLETKTKAVNANNIARVANSQLTNADEKLHPLLSLKNGRTLEKFPDTSKALAKLSVTVVDAMLSALEADRTGNEMEKREKLRLQIGLKPNPA
ncbi:hypothetical protein D6C84_04383 [Aureobasidium pullulans]|uniref:Uncharacterized protein n=1 Tax=Aureobasidium pullulans TaxID=5580 RepID=A0A1A7MER3_AURPU|nr:MAG: Uncharacterized protein AUREO_049810 [Aureobasidium pullulans]THV74577.1 hypothetical protein D6D29_08881 [Aureobasidium pullulans]THW24481.1 hypothetical protein D6D23_05199 [Aureobasidium pullulans]THW39767.1 hypothetical protein D6D21_07163 [Aureobasidium pullulans]THW51771.1 hypothetical protein D6D22_00612 [Aureobasidium pullulans]